MVTTNPLKKQTKICPVCKRPFHNRKKWQGRGQWDAVVYCSTRCRQTAKTNNTSKIVDK